MIGASDKILPPLLVSAFEYQVMNPTFPLIYLHGLLSDSRGVKARLLRERFPEIVIPDFDGSLEERMQHLYSILGDTPGWTIVGSSFGGLMGAMFTCGRPQQVRKLVLFSPALVWPDFASTPPEPVDVPTVIYHGLRDDLVPIEPVRKLAGQVFQKLTFHAVDDDHGMYKTVHELDWEEVLQ
jgi:pimeloyl-ACP methyl ester carboxylesterase